MQDGVYARFTTSKGEILAQLEYQKTPGTVGSFVGLAEGNLENEVKPQGTPYYDGLKFHRVIEDFMIQGGCPQGTGTAGPGYNFDDEIHPELKHDKAGVLSMANAGTRGGEGTNGSQFFITHNATEWLDGNHTVFGNVVEGQDVVNAIAQDDIIEKITIERVGKEAEGFNAVEAFRVFTGAREERLAKAKAEREQEFKELTQGFEKTDTGLFYKILEKGEGEKAQKGKTVSVHYAGMLTDGRKFDSSYERNQPLDFVLGGGQVIQGWDQGIQLLDVGDKARLVIPSDLAYGSHGAGGVIPPDATLIFDVELVAVK